MSGARGSWRRRALLAVGLLLAAAVAMVCVVDLARLKMHSSDPARLLQASLVGSLVPVGSTDPTQIHIALTNDPSSIVVSWVTTTVTSEHVVLLGTEPGKLELVVQGSAHQYTLFFGVYKSPFLHDVVLTGLKPSTRYYYVCGDRTTGLSSEFSFVTGPALGKVAGNRQEPLIRVVVVGDVGSSDQSQNTIDKVLGQHLSLNQGVNFIMHTGDLSYANGWQPLWDTFGAVIQPVAAQIPYMTAVGNHEYIVENGIPYLNRFRMPNHLNKIVYWSINYGPLHLVALSSEQGFSLGSAQYTWLEKDLAEANRNRDVVPWIVCFFHRPWYTSNNAHGNFTEMRDDMEDLLQKHKVDVVIAGHVHAYERSHPMYKDQVTADGIVHMLVGNGGNKEGLATDWIFPQPPFVAHREATFGFARFDIHNSTHLNWMLYRNSNRSGEPVDQAWIVRRV